MELRGVISPDRPLLVVAVGVEAAGLGSEHPVLICGVGKVAAGQAVLHCLSGIAPSLRPRALLNLGTAGALRPGLEGVHSVGAVVQHDIDGASIEKLTGRNPAPRIELGDGLTLATGDRFIQDATERDELARSADLVDMEAYAVVAAGRLLGVRTRVVKHVSDNADAAALRTWLDAVAESSAALGSWLRSSAESVVAVEVESNR